MKKYTRRRGRNGRRRPRHKKQTRSKKYSRRRSLCGGVSKRSRATPPKASSRSAKLTPGLLVSINGVSVSQSSRAPKTSLRNAGISKEDTDALEAARIISNFPRGMDKFLEMVINNYELLSYEGVKYALRQQISINTAPAVGRLSKNGIIFISYICGKLLCLLKELSTLTNSEVGKKSELLREIKQIEKVICLLDGVGCSWGVRPYNQAEMDAIADHYEKDKDRIGLQTYYQKLNALIDKYFPVLKKYTDPSHVVSSSMCRRLIPGHVMSRLPTIEENP
jgi:hypothetical protein